MCSEIKGFYGTYVRHIFRHQT